MKGIKQKKLILYISSLVVIGIISVIVMLSYFNIREKIHNQMYNNYMKQLDELTSQVTKSIHFEIENSVYILEGIGECKNLQQRDIEKNLDYLRSIKYKGNFTSLGIIDVDGNAYDIKNRRWKIKDKNKRIIEKLRELKNKSKYYISDVLPSKIKNTKEVFIAIPLYKDDEKTKMNGFLFGYYPILEFSDRIDISNSQQYFQLIDTKGNYISHSSNKNAFADGSRTLWEELKRYNLSSRTLVEVKKDIEEGKKGVFYVENKGDGRYVVYQPLGINKWYLFSVFTKTELNDRAEEFQNITEELLLYLLTLKIVLVLVIVGTAMYIYKVIKIQSKKLEIKNKIFRMLANKTRDIFIEIHLSKGELILYDFTENKDEVTMPIEEFYPQNMLELGKIKSENYSSYEKLYNKILNGENIENYIFQIRRNGVWKWFRLNAGVFNSENIVGILEDFTEEKEKEFEFLRISEKSKYDFLTRLYNRENFELEFDYFINKELDENMVSGLFIMDLDNFKIINDVFGHRIGDKVLKESAHTLKTALRSSDILGRLGGDEFVLLIKNAPNIRAIQKIAEKINLSLTKTYTKDEKEITVSCSIGIKIIEKGSSFKKAYEGADLALYRVKYNGRNSYYING